MENNKKITVQNEQLKTDVGKILEIILEGLRSLEKQ